MKTDWTNRFGLWYTDIQSARPGVFSADTEEKSTVDIDKLKETVAQNMMALRLSAGLKQAELAEQIHYSDKSVSKWERAEALPDVAVLKSVADVFGVTVDYLITPHAEGETVAAAPAAPTVQVRVARHRLVTRIVLIGIWTLALLLFIIFWLAGHPEWVRYVVTGALPVSLIAWLVLHSVWERGRLNVYIISALTASLLLTLYTVFYRYNWWQLFLLQIPIEGIILCGFGIARASKKPPKN